MRKLLIIVAVSVLILQGSAFAFETEGDVIFRDALYGAAIGAILGGAIYLADDDNIGAKLGIGVAVGTLGGLVFGVMETRSFAEIEKDKIKFAFPTPLIEKKGDGLRFATSLLKAQF
jgi:hypothetical protein